jgi:hypothetical protein
VVVEQAGLVVMVPWEPLEAPLLLARFLLLAAGEAVKMESMQQEQAVVQVVVEPPQVEIKLVVLAQQTRATQVELV